MQQGLNDFAYQTEIAWCLFAGAAMLALVIALLTISFSMVKVAHTNPVKSLEMNSDPSGLFRYRTLLYGNGQHYCCCFYLRGLFLGFCVFGMLDEWIVQN